jgi:hypothetical protein
VNKKRKKTNQKKKKNMKKVVCNKSHPPYTFAMCSLADVEKFETEKMRDNRTFFGWSKGWLAAENTMKSELAKKKLIVEEEVVKFATIKGFQGFHFFLVFSVKHNYSKVFDALKQHIDLVELFNVRATQNHLELYRVFLRNLDSSDSVIDAPIVSDEEAVALANTELNALRVEIGEAQRVKIALESEISAVEKQIFVSREKAAACEVDLRALMNDVLCQRDVLRAVHEDIRMKSVEAGKYDDDIDSKKQSLSDLEAAVVAKTSALSEVEALLSVRQSELSVVESSIEEKNVQLSDIGASIAQRERLLGELEVQISECEGRFSETSRVVTETVNELREVERRHLVAVEDADKAAARLASMTGECAAKSEELAKLAELHSVKTAELEDIGLSIPKAAARLAGMTGECAAKSEELAKLAELHSVKTAELQDLKLSIPKAMLELAAIMSDVDVAKAERDLLLSNIQNEKCFLQQTCKDLASVEKKLRHKKAELVVSSQSVTNASVNGYVATINAQTDLVNRVSDFLDVLRSVFTKLLLFSGTPQSRGECAMVGYPAEMSSMPELVKLECPLPAGSAVCTMVHVYAKDTDARVHAVSELKRVLRGLAEGVARGSGVSAMDNLGDLSILNALDSSGDLRKLVLDYADVFKNMERVYDAKLVNGTMEACNSFLGTYQCNVCIRKVDDIPALCDFAVMIIQEVRVLNERLVALSSERRKSREATVSKDHDAMLKYIEKTVGVLNSIANADAKDLLNMTVTGLGSKLNAPVQAVLDRVALILAYHNGKRRLASVHEEADGPMAMDKRPKYEPV